MRDAREMKGGGPSEELEEVEAELNKVQSMDRFDRQRGREREREGEKGREGGREREVGSGGGTE